MINPPVDLEGTKFSISSDLLGPWRSQGVALKALGTQNQRSARIRHLPMIRCFGRDFPRSGDSNKPGWLVVLRPTTLKNDGVSSSVGMTILPNSFWKVIKFHGSKPPTRIDRGFTGDEHLWTVTFSEWSPPDHVFWIILTLSDILSGVSGIYSDIPSDMWSGSWHFIWKRFWDNWHQAPALLLIQDVGWEENVPHTLWLCQVIAIENGHWNSEFSH